MISKDKKSIYDRKRYETLYKPSRFGERKCALCEILLKYEAYNTRRFCRGCSQTPNARRLQNRECYQNRIIRFT